MFPFDEMAPIIQRSVLRAGDAIAAIYQSEQPLQVESKADESPLTQADLQAHRILVADLQHHYPNIPIVSEEGQIPAYAVRSKYKAFWLIDPLDGTKEFIKRTGEFTVNVALIVQQKPVFGLVYVPMHNDLYIGYQKRAYRICEGVRTVIQATAFSLEDAELCFVTSRSHLNEETMAYLRDFNSPKQKAIGSSLKFMLLARGDAQVYPRFGPTSEWDTAAAQAVLEAAGGEVLQADTKLPLTYNKPDILNPHFIAYGKRK